MMVVANYAANVIVENMYAQFDFDGKISMCCLMQSLIIIIWACQALSHTDWHVTIIGQQCHCKITKVWKSYEMERSQPHERGYQTSTNPFQLN